MLNVGVNHPDDKQGMSASIYGYACVCVCISIHLYIYIYMYMYVCIAYVCYLSVWAAADRLPLASSL